MKCPECSKKGLKSRVYVDDPVSTAFVSRAYYDEDGEFHPREVVSVTTTTYQCVCGHVWTERRPR